MSNKFLLRYQLSTDRYIGERVDDALATKMLALNAGFIVPECDLPESVRDKGMSYFWSDYQGEVAKGEPDWKRYIR